MLERASKRLIALPGGKLTPLPTDGGKSLPLDGDSHFKRIAYVITYLALCRHAQPSGSQFAGSWPWPWPQKGLAVGCHRQLHQHHSGPHSGWNRAKPFRQLVQFAAANHRRPNRSSGSETGRADRRRGFIGSGWICGCGRRQDKRFGLILAFSLDPGVIA
jgi:hypothetical protein